MEMEDEVTGITTSWLCKFSCSYFSYIYFAVAKHLYPQTVFACTEREIREILMEEEGERDDGRPHPPPLGPPEGPKCPPAGGPERPKRWRRNRGRNPVSINVSYIHNNNACDDNYSRCFILLHF